MCHRITCKDYEKKCVHKGKICLRNSQYVPLVPSLSSQEATPQNFTSANHFFAEVRFPMRYAASSHTASCYGNPTPFRRLSSFSLLTSSGLQSHGYFSCYAGCKKLFYLLSNQGAGTCPYNWILPVKRSKLCWLCWAGGPAAADLLRRHDGFRW